MADSGTTFSYARLALAKDQKQIRLLKLLPSLDANQILCALEIVDWASELRYAAISYVWGDPSVKKAISINDQPFYITENLYTALWHIRKNDMLRQDGSEQPLLLWADAVCIDQDNNEERNHQVSFMGSIYGSASKAIYWLGRLEDDILSGDAAITAIQEMAEAAFHDSSVLDTDSLKNFLAAHKGLSVPRTFDPNAATFSSLPPVWHSLQRILDCEFWQRVWIIQEVALPVSQHALCFTCGNSTATWTRFLQFTEIVKFITKSSDNPLGLTRSVHRDLSIALMPGGSNITVLRQFRRRNERLAPGSLPSFATLYRASNPLDYVYGFGAVLGSEPVVNYKKSKKEVYLDWFKDAMKYGPVFDLTAYAGIGLLGTTNQKWPSWLPDLSSVHDSPYKLAARSMLEEVVDSQQPFGNIDGNVLHISGLRLGDKVARIFEPEPGRPKQEHDQKSDFIHYICFSILANASSHHPLGVTPLRAFIITVANCFVDTTNRGISFQHPLDTNDPMVLGIILKVLRRRSSARPWLSHDHWESTYGPGWVSMGLRDGEHLAEKLQEQVLGDPLALGLLDPKLWPDFAPAVKLGILLSRYATFQTINGHIGIGPPGMKEGDELCFFPERGSPGLLRLEQENGSMVTKFVGVCYIHESSVSVMKDSVASGSAKVEGLSLH